MMIESGLGIVVLTLILQTWPNSDLNQQFGCWHNAKGD